MVLSCYPPYAGGDLISLLPGLRHVFKETGKKWIIYQRIDFELFYYEGMIPATVDSEGKAVSMNRRHFDMLKPLLLAQDYIEDFREWKGEKCDIDMEKSRDLRTIPIPYSPLVFWGFFIAPELQCDLSEAWVTFEPIQTIQPITIDVTSFDITLKDAIEIWHQTGNLYYKQGITNILLPNLCKDKILINRTQRYTNPNVHYYFLKQYEKDLIFTGTKDEYNLFCKQWELNIPYLEVKDFYELVQAIDLCKFTICNQSLFFHLCDSIKKPRILEVCSKFPNTFPTGKDGYAFVYQEALEIYTHKLFNK
ncbi:MAG: hypothetical protein ACYCZW_03870 [Minisyncoccota bacterium]